MRHDARNKRRFTLCLLLACLLAAPAVSYAFDDYYYYLRSNWEMQREANATQEEAVRAPLREKRSEEVEQEQKAATQEHEIYFDSIMAASRAAAGRPRGQYYRKPGFISTDAPTNSQTVTVNKLTYLYDQGVFWVAVENRYIVVTAPFGAVVNALPAAAGRVFGKAAGVFYFYGTFFAPTKDGKYQVIKPPAGVLVDYLPDGYVELEVKGATYFKFGEVYFKPYIAAGADVYQTVDR